MSNLILEPSALFGELDRLVLTPARSYAALSSSYAEAATQCQLKTMSTYVDLAGKAHRAALGARTPADVEQSIGHLADIGRELQEQMESDREMVLHLNRSFTDTLEKFAESTCTDILRSA